jgi:hypothetical protein
VRARDPPVASKALASARCAWPAVTCTLRERERECSPLSAITTTGAFNYRGRQRARGRAGQDRVGGWLIGVGGAQERRQCVQAGCGVGQLQLRDRVIRVMKVMTVKRSLVAAIGKEAKHTGQAGNGEGRPRVRE